ncbi:uncharacterized protein LOC122391114 isoform X1 [Amphibalanus amphitrite]|uniref:uncharacterized protein LOC122391114 isoform X1 n=1 Tax=Amphibalanus amphitrite TaxID=1232801 RepID=UPI001C9103F5|nr:uncharacterized protein LOC122391114 isoform X1 [Amphibalanus amphitrite]
MQLTRKLNIKFRNMRKRSVSPSVVEFREERSKKRQQYRQVTVAKLPNYNLPVVNTATTDEGLINLMKFDKNADTHELMISTFPRRRQELLGTKGRRGMTMAALKRRFPALFTFEQTALRRLCCASWGSMSMFSPRTRPDAPT